MNLRFEAITRLSLDIYDKGVKTVTNEEGKTIDANEALRKLLLEKCNGEFSYRNFKRVEHDFFEIIEETITVSSASKLKETLSPLMVWKDTELGDKTEFIVENPELFEVSVTADGSRNLRRQRVFKGRVNTVAYELGIKIYEELFSFMTGIIDWSALIDKVVKSFEKQVAKEIAKAFGKAYDGINPTELKVEGAYNEKNFLELVAKVGNNPVIYGTKLALSKLPGIASYQADADDRRNYGYVRIFNGIKCVELENGYDKDTKTWDLDNQTLFIIPEGDKVVYGGFEGEALVLEDTSGTRMDRQVEFDFVRMLRLGVAIANRFGAYKVNA